MVSQIYQLSFPLTVILLILTLVCAVVLFVCVRWCLRFACAVVALVSQSRSQPDDSKPHLADSVIHAKEE